MSNEFRLKPPLAEERARCGERGIFARVSLEGLTYMLSLAVSGVVALRSHSAIVDLGSKL